ncbi:MAG: hypothetical protein JWM57_1184 [Phycisphaerales bacterium]|nr:hypothetical protein [Phycisphaerales bacterium]
MKVLPVLALAFALGLGSVSSLRAEDAPAETPKAAKPAKGRALTGVWGKMGSLTPEQKQQIGTLHKQALLDKKKIDDKEQSDILALLTPEQKAEYDKLNDEATTAKKKTSKTSGGGKAGEAETPATQPADGGM